MNGYIEVTEKDLGLNILFPLDKINAVVQGNDGVFIDIGNDDKGESSGVYVTETYEKIKEKIKQAREN